MGERVRGGADVLKRLRRVDDWGRGLKLRECGEGEWVRGSGLRMTARGWEGG